ncbi:hypothetical protein K461DRAFT_230997 [Myriangium duriaei CBS 260.36]|uniref:UBC core domain-containing protein n=1 Tax=Myriangium duriaei CBS 260.36 TaxID=1168546 RepID=A0A9P4IV07_9PEZI|nr:hypothetical protein K461DRAFT_230997 [Myriangium duriaei CBS 260.36]
MPRKRFLQDYALASSTNSVPQVHDLCRGEDDGQISFLYTHHTLTEPVKITALASDLGDYPDSHHFMVFADEHAPSHVAQAISDRLSSVNGKNIHDLIKHVASVLTNLCSHDGDDFNSASDLEDEDEDDSSMDDDDDDAIFDPTADFNPHHPLSGDRAGKVPGSSLPPAARDRIRSDLRFAKNAGFKVGSHGFLMQGTGAVVSISCRIRKLGISDEAIRAWQLRPDDYLIMLLRYPVGYRDLQQLQSTDKSQIRSNFEVRVGCGPLYKPAYLDTIRAFQAPNLERSDAQNQWESAPSQQPTPSTFNDTFISRPLVELINSRLLTLIMFRQYGLSWLGAESFYNDNNGCFADNMAPMDDTYFQADRSKVNYSPLVMADHVSRIKANHLSLPLLAMQFMLRHFVRCTEFCLVCHRRLPDDLEALKPYVCDRPLCLYQYLTLGFGPSLEHEILSQPVVADLLISFCYHSAVEKNLNSFPNGLNLTVPKACADVLARLRHNVLNTPTHKGLEGDFDVDRHVIKLQVKGQRSCPFKVGQWITCVPSQGNSKMPLPVNAQTFHCRIIETEYHPTVRVSQPVTTREFSTTQPHKQPLFPGPPLTEPDGKTRPWRTVQIYGYDQSFDDLSDTEKHEAIVCLLNTLPDVDEMKSYLLTSGNGSLKDWKERIPPSALSVLRWIIASNRACILHVPDDNSESQQERVRGMKGWTQFRFAMGAPDKEHRFVKAVRETKSRLNLTYPTLFAWHGSASKNWHSIIREGLNYDKVINGRAYGNGCYHSLQHATSLGYSSNLSPSYSGGSGWPSSLLRPDCVMSLNEIVNAPNEFQSSTPHLVVQHIDWIQTRYLFVKTHGSQAGNATAETKLTNILPQDPKFTPVGERDPIVIPAKPTTAAITVPAKRKSPFSVKSRASKKKVKGRGTQGEPMELGSDTEPDDNSSQMTEDEDRNMLIEEIDLTDVSEVSPHDSGMDGPPVFNAFAGCRFKPGSLDHKSLPIMPQPSYANSATTKRLQKDFAALLKVQDSTLARELGWYIDPEKFENVYQWIVELHSFDQIDHDGGKLPLAKDMEKAGIDSIVLELRFGSSYPMSPPFVRVVRPRFLGFQQGGGGHVTAGGAMCMELLTNDGWTAATSLEAVLLQVRLAMASTEPKPARLEQIYSRGNGKNVISGYGAGEAVEAYKRACRMHGWTIPADFDATARAGPA